MGKTSRQLFNYITDLQFEEEQPEIRGTIISTNILSGLLEAKLNEATKGRTPVEVFNMNFVYEQFLHPTYDPLDDKLIATLQARPGSNYSSASPVDSFSALLKKRGNSVENRFRLYGEEIERLVMQKGQHTAPRAAMSRDYRVVRESTRVLY